MHKACKNCGSSNTEHARFCAKCGSPIHAHEHAHERTPAEQAAEISGKAKVEVNKAMEKTKHVWFGFSKSEKIEAVGALAALVAFVLPWVSMGGQAMNGGFSAASNSGYVYLLQLLLVASLVLLYFTQGASGTRKAFMARREIIIGSVSATVGLFMIIFISTIGSLMSQVVGGIGALFGGGGFGVGAGIGLYLYAAGAIAIVVGAVRLQGKLLQQHHD